MLWTKKEIKGGAFESYVQLKGDLCTQKAKNSLTDLV